MKNIDTPKGAVFSQDRRHRYLLWRQIRQTEEDKIVSFIGLNPSTADENVDDPTVRRCINFAKSWGYSKMFMLNLFSFRATKPRDLFKSNIPNGPANDFHLQYACIKSEIMVAAWGTKGTYMGRDKEVKSMLINLHYLKLTKGGHPAHPLYLPKTLEPIPWDASQ